MHQDMAYNYFKIKPEVDKQHSLIYPYMHINLKLISLLQHNVSCSLEFIIKIENYEDRLVIISS